MGERRREREKEKKRSERERKKAAWSTATPAVSNVVEKAAENRRQKNDAASDPPSNVSVGRLIDEIDRGDSRERYPRSRPNFVHRSSGRKVVALSELRRVLCACTKNQGRNRTFVNRRDSILPLSLVFVCRFPLCFFF